MIYLFLEAHKTMICSRNKQFLMPSPENSWSYCSMFLNETPMLKDNNQTDSIKARITIRRLSNDM